MGVPSGSVELSGVPPFTYRIKEIPYAANRVGNSHAPQLLIMQVDAEGAEYLFGEISPLTPETLQWVVDALNAHPKLTGKRTRSTK